MNKNSITGEITSKYIVNYLENSGKISYRELGAADKLSTVLYKDLPSTEVEGFPVASEFVNPLGRPISAEEFARLSAEDKSACSLRYHFLPYLHELYVGTTGSGKTTGCVEPQLRAISSQKNKPNLFLTDPKGELFERNARHLHEQGYRTFILNFKDITRSDKWNPLLEMYEKKQATMHLGDSCVLRTGSPSDNLVLNAMPEEFDGEHYVEYDGRAFPNGGACDYYIAFQRDNLDAEIESLVNQFCNMMIKVQSKTDASWEYGAHQLLKGIVLCMLEDSITPDSGFTQDMMTLNTIQKYYDRLRNDLTPETRRYNVRSHPLLRNKSRRTLIPLYVALDNAPRTMLSYCGVFDGATKDWFQGHIFALTTGNTVELNAEDDSPYAIFVITRDYEKSDFTVAGMFIDWVYRKALEEAERSVRTTNGRPATRPVHFLLDEFGNVPEIRDFENKIATARSRNIWFHLVLQSYEQLDLVYGKEKAVVICDNCNSQSFLGAQSRATKERFSNECGKRNVPTLEATLNPSDTSVVERPVVPISDLDLIKSGEIYVKRIYSPVIKSQFVRSYVAAAQGAFPYFYDTKAYRDFSPINMEPFNGKKYTFAPLVDASGR